MFILMDINMPEFNRYPDVSRCWEDEPQSRIVMLTMLDEVGSVFNAMRVGRQGIFAESGSRRSDCVIRGSGRWPGGYLARSLPR